MKLENNVLSLNLEVYTEDDNFYEAPDRLGVSLTKKELISFLGASQVVKQLGGYSVTFWDNRGEFFNIDETPVPDDWRVDVVQLEITRDGLMSWNGCMKNTNIRWYTETFNTKDVGGK